jgi:2-C-methyl-D-erythritol 4-phosphate cytidylyltransferase
MIPRRPQNVPEPVHFLVPAAGSGSRFGGERPKQFRDVAGRPLLAWTIARLFAGGAESIVVAQPDDVAAAPPAWLGSDPRLRIVAGGATRQASVALALQHSSCGAQQLVGVHDGARPALAREDLAAVCAAAAADGVDGAVLGRPLADTLKRVVDGRIVTTVERSQLFRAETPQVFRRAVLERAIAAAAEARFVGTDEASLVERLPGIRLVAVEASHPNPKVTTPADVPVVEAVLDALADPEEVREWR